MQKTKWPSLIFALLIIATVFFPWLVIQSKNITISGVNAEGTSFGKPGYFNLLLMILFLLFSFIPRGWAQRVNLFLAAFNLGWTLRNFILLSACDGGECPSRQPFFYVFLIAGILLLVSVIFQKVPSPAIKKDE